MADVPAIDTATGKPVAVPQEAAAQQHASGKITFAPGTRVPVVKDGVEGTVDGSVLGQEMADNGVEPNFDPGGAAKAAAAGAGRGLSFGATDWAAIHGAELLGGSKAGEHARQVLSGLREEHPVASAAGEIAGAVAPMLIPGVGEAELAGAAGGAGRGAIGAVEAGRAGAEALAGGQEALALSQAGEAAKAVAAADARSGRTVGSALGTLFRHGNPGNLVGQLGAGAENYVGKLFGPAAGKAARFSSEGALIGAANALDESELGDTPITGEALWSGVEHGILFGSALGLVGTGAEKALVAAGRVASRVAEGRLGGTAGQYRGALARRGPGADGHRALEEGIITPFSKASEMYDRAKAVASRDGQTIEGVVREADAAYSGVEAHAAREELHRAVDEAADDGILAGGSLGPLKQRIKDDWDAAVGWKRDPPPMPKMEGEAERLYAESWRKGKLIDPNTPPPRPPTNREVTARWKSAVDAEGLGTIQAERVPKRVDAAGMAAYREMMVSKLAGVTDQAERARIGQILTNPASAHAFALEEAQGVVLARNARRAELRQEVVGKLNADHGFAKDYWDRQMDLHDTLKRQAGKLASDAQAQQDHLYAHSVSAIRRHNQELTVPIAKVREFRGKLDDIIPWQRGQDATTNAAIEMKKAARTALESHVEKAMDEAAQSKNPELYARYVHAKFRYGQAKDIERMLERARAREASQFGRHKFGDYGGVMAHGVAGLMFGHPLGGLAAGALNVAGRKYGPSLAAWALHKVSRFAEMKALRAEVQVAMRRSVRSAAVGGQATRYATVAVPNLPPHELRSTAAQAMVAVMKTARGTDLPARLASLHPDLPILAPMAHQAVEGTARRGITWLATKIPARVQAALTSGGEVTSRDISDSEARNFLEGSAVVQDPRVATDALAHGTLTPTMAEGHKATWPGLHAQSVATYARMAAMDPSAHAQLSPGRKSQAQLLGMAMSSSPKGMTMALQQSAAASAAGAAAKPAPAGRVHASAGLSKMTAASLATTQTQALEGTSPGRRGRRAGGAGLGSF